RTSLGARRRFPRRRLSCPHWLRRRELRCHAPHCTQSSEGRSRWARRERTRRKEQATARWLARRIPSPCVGSHIMTYLMRLPWLALGECRVATLDERLEFDRASHVVVWREEEACAVPQLIGSGESCTGRSSIAVKPFAAMWGRCSNSA